jgi:hypothetical protein
VNIEDRDGLERKLARILGRLLAAQMGRLLELLGDPPNISNLPINFWGDAGTEMAGVLRPFLESLYVESAKQMMDNVGIGVDWALVNENAAEWASRHSFELVTGINNTSRNTLQRAVSRYFADGQTIGELTSRLSRSFGPVRAEMIAITEVTRAATEGEREFLAELVSDGVEMIPIWQTSNDERVCPICGPRYNKPIEDGQYPPAHVRCRCWVNHEIAELRQ